MEMRTTPSIDVDLYIRCFHRPLGVHYSLYSRVRSPSNVTVITRNLRRKLRVGKIENYV